ncbi:MAG: glycosyltransferase family 2 protein [Candidatus Bathyarchaeia archaeon]
MNSISYRDKPLISVIMVTRNRAHLLPRAIKSVLNQTYPHFELIIVDGGSTDNTREVIGSFKDSRIVYYRQTQDKGLHASRNIGLNLARGDYIAFLDDDDELVPGALETAIDTFSKLKPLKVEILWFDRLDVERNKLSGFGLKEEGFVAYEKYLCWEIRGDYWLVFSKKVFEGVRFPEDLWGLESITLLKLHQKHKAYYIPKVLYRNYREHGPRLCNPSFEDIVKLAPRYMLTLERFLCTYEKDLLRLCPQAYWQSSGILGFYQVLSGKKLRGLRNIIRALVKAPSSLRYAKKYLIALAALPFTPRQIITLYKSYLKLKKKCRKNP